MPEQQPTSPVPFPSGPASHEPAPLQPNLFPTNPAIQPRHPSEPIPFPALKQLGRPSPQRIPYWLEQAERFLRVIVRIYIGLVVCLVPWYPPFWDANPLFAHWPWLTALVTQGAVRGLVSGLGLLNLWVALKDMIHLPDHPRTR